MKKSFHISVMVLILLPISKSLYEIVRIIHAFSYLAAIVTKDSLVPIGRDYILRLLGEYLILVACLIVFLFLILSYIKPYLSKNKIKHL